MKGHAMTDSNVIRLPGTEDLFSANPRGAVGVFPSCEGNGSWGTVHINPRGYTIAYGSAFLPFYAAEAYAAAVSPPSQNYRKLSRPS
jgi:hypothetical protein